MEIIEFDRWRPSVDNPRQLEYVGQRTAEEVFSELKHRLEGQGYLPDEYFMLSDRWENGREIPRDADLFCTVDYGESEGVYVDVYLKWCDEKQQKSVTERFITGKTLGQNGNDLDRMFLTASAITKAVHGDHATHARYMKISGVEEDTGGRVIHLSQQEEKVIIEALVEQRERQEQSMSQTEQLLRRMTGSITAYMDTVGRRPLRLDSYDRAVLAIRDGELDAFQTLYPEVKDRAHDLLVEAAGRPGIVGWRMTATLLNDAGEFPEPAYRAACLKAIDIDDFEKVSFLLEKAESHVPGLPASFPGEMASHAYLEHQAIARAIVRQCSDGQIAAAPPRLLEQFAFGPDYQMLHTLVKKGISGGPDAWRIMQMLTSEKRDQWTARDLLETRMWVDPQDYDTLLVCVKNGAAEVGKLLLDGGMDFDQYLQRHPHSPDGETLQALADHWAELKAAQAQEQEQEQDPAPQQAGGMTLG